MISLLIRRYLGRNCMAGHGLDVYLPMAAPSTVDQILRFANPISWQHDRKIEELVYVCVRFLPPIPISYSKIPNATICYYPSIPPYRHTNFRRIHPPFHQPIETQSTSPKLNTPSLAYLGTYSRSSGWKTNALTSMLSLGSTSSPAPGSTNAVCGTLLARPSVFESKHLMSRTSAGASPAL